jgi:hypothetical protein
MGIARAPMKEYGLEEVLRGQPLAKDDPVKGAGRFGAVLIVLGQTWTLGMIEILEVRKSDGIQRSGIGLERGRFGQRYHHGGALLRRSARSNERPITP